MSWFADLVIILAISQLLMLGLSFLLLQKGKLALMMSLFSFCLIAYLLAQLSAVPESPLFVYILNRFATMTPLALWLIAFYLFVDEGKVSVRVWVLMAAFVAVRAIGVPLYDPTAAQSSLWFLIIYFIPQLILLGFSIHSVYIASHGYRVDLIEHRRTARLIFVIGMGILLVVVVGNGFFSFVDPFLSQIQLFSLPPVPVVVFPLYIFFLTLGINLTLFRFNADVFTLLSSNGKNSLNHNTLRQSQDPINTRLMENVITAMERDKLYQEAGLSIAELAKRLSIQEYQLRRLINKKLNYRNFNQFLNHYRILESCDRLGDPEQIELPIASIAMDVGYSSLSSFNKAFKEIRGVTPSAFRHATLSEYEVIE